MVKNKKNRQDVENNVEKLKKNAKIDKNSREWPKQNLLKNR